MSFFSSVFITLAFSSGFQHLNHIQSILGTKAYKFQIEVLFLLFIHLFLSGSGETQTRNGCETALVFETSSSFSRIATVFLECLFL